MTISVVKNVFNAGELSPKVYSRSDTERWPAGCKTMLNFIPLPQGGVQRRPGFEYIASAKNNNAIVRLIPFQFSQDQAYMLECGNSYMRVFKDGGQIEAAGNDTKLLLHLDGVDASTDIPDSGVTGHTVACNNNAKLSTAYPKFGTASLVLDGSGDLPTMPTGIAEQMPLPLTHGFDLRRFPRRLRPFVVNTRMLPIIFKFSSRLSKKGVLDKCN